MTRSGARHFIWLANRFQTILSSGDYQYTAETNFPEPIPFPRF